MQSSYYPEKIMYYLLNLPNAGRLEVNNETVFCLELGEHTGNPKIKLYLEIENAIIKQVKYLVYGDGYIIAVLGKLSEDLPGLKISQAMNYSFTQLGESFTIPQAKMDKIKLIKNGLNTILQQYLEQHKSHSK